MVTSVHRDKVLVPSANGYPLEKVESKLFALQLLLCMNINLSHLIRKSIAEINEIFSRSVAMSALYWPVQSAFTV